MDVATCIAELLSVHDCVIIPGFGGFIGSYCPARIDPLHHAFHPPAKNLLFNINLKQNDGLLVNAVASEAGESYSEACRQVDDFSEHCHAVLRAGEKIFLPRIGQLFQGQEGIILFEQDLSANLLPDSFGLTSFVSPPVFRNTAPVRHPALSGRQLTRTGGKFVMPRAMKWAAMLALPVGISAIIGITQYSGLPVDLASKAGVLTSVFSRFSAASLVEKKEAPAPVRKTVIMAVPAAPVAEAPKVISHDDRYAVIVGAFRIRDNAEKLIGQLQKKGIAASVFDQSKTGLFRVTIGTSSDKDHARQLLASAKTRDFSEAWLLAK